LPVLLHYAFVLTCVYAFHGNYKYLTDIVRGYFSVEGRPPTNIMMVVTHHLPHTSLYAIPCFCDDADVVTWSEDEVVPAYQNNYFLFRALQTDRQT